MSRFGMSEKRLSASVAAAGIALSLIAAAAANYRTWTLLDTANDGYVQIHYTTPSTMEVSESSRNGMTLRATNRLSHCIRIKYNLDYAYRYVDNKTEMHINPGGISVNANSQNYSFVSYPNITDVSLQILDVRDC